MASPEAPPQARLTSPDRAPERRQKPYEIINWSSDYVEGIDKLERTVWPPWLRKPITQINFIANNFPDTNFLTRDTNTDSVVATLTTNRINWDRDPRSLESWDVIAGGSVALSNYEGTYVPDGNTLCLMAANVQPDKRGLQFASQMLMKLRDEIAPNMKNIENIVSFFRPSDYGKEKMDAIREGRPVKSFEEYCKLTRENDGLPQDPWLRSIKRYGMELVTTDDGRLRIAEESMRVEVSLAEFEHYKNTFRPAWVKDDEPFKWVEHNGRWECGETGSWQVFADKAVYTEPNVLGAMRIPYVPRTRPTTAAAA